MKFIFDFDGVLTDFNRFIRENAIGYFQKKYHMPVVNPDALEIEDIFDIQNTLKKPDIPHRRQTISENVCWIVFGSAIDLLSFHF